MNKISYEELWNKYLLAKETIMELTEKLEDREWKIDLLQTNISELEDILYEFNIFQRYHHD